MVVSETSKDFVSVGVFEIVTALCFTKNKALWCLDSEEFPIINDIKSGKKLFDLSIESPGNGVLKFLTGLIFFAFYNYDKIGNQYISIAKIKESAVVEVVFFDGKKNRFNVNNFDENTKSFFERSFQLLLGKNNLILDENVFINFSKMFKSASSRLIKEADFFKKMLRHNSYIDFFTADDISITSICIILSTLPQSQMNLFFMKFSNYINPEIEIKTGNGVNINAKAFLGYDTVDISELNNKVRVILLLNQIDKNIVKEVLKNNDMLNKIKEFLENSDVKDYIHSNIKDTLDGQYLPRIDVINSFLKIIDAES